MDINQHIKKNALTVRKFYEHLHAHPELSFQEIKTANFIEKQLREMGLKTHRLPQNAVLGYLKGNGKGKTIGIRAEMDALPLKEQTPVNFISKNDGVMHACGHDLHISAALGTALVLNQHKSKLNNNVLFIFQHAEEKIPGGAQNIIKSEFFNQHKPDIMLAQHVFPELKAGEVGFRSGTYMASGDEIDIHIIGPGGHAAMPHKTIDTVTSAAHVLIALQQIRSRFIPAEIPAVLSFGNIITNSVMNIIPQKVILEGTFRIMDEEWRKKTLKKIKEIATHAAQTMGAKCNILIRNGYPSIKNDEINTEKIRKIANQILGSKNVKKLPVRMTTDDFGYYTLEIPSVYYRLGAANENGKCAELHTPEFLPDPKTLDTGIQLLTHILLTFK